MNEGPAHNVVPGQDEKKLFFVLCLTVGIMIVEVLGGYFSGSLALLADAGHMFTDAAGLFLSWSAVRLGRRAPDSARTYGYQRFKILAAYTNGILLFFLCFVIGSEAINRIAHPRDIDGPMMLVIAVIGLAANAASLFILHGSKTPNPQALHRPARGKERDVPHHEKKDDLNIQSATLHIMSDLMGSLGAVTAGVIVSLTGWRLADPLLSLLIVVLIFFYAIGLVKKTVHILVEGAPDPRLSGKIREALMTEIRNLKDVHHIHVWSLTEKQPLATLHVTLDEAADAQAALCDIQRVLEQKFHLDHVTVQVEKTPCVPFNL